MEMTRCRLNVGNPTYTDDALLLGHFGAWLYKVMVQCRVCRVEIILTDEKINIYVFHFS